eukprot:1176643-Prorocentrum_minimum.AAC.1
MREVGATRAQAGLRCYANVTPPGVTCVAVLRECHPACGLRFSLTVPFGYNGRVAKERKLSWVLGRDGRRAVATAGARVCLDE